MADNRTLYSPSKARIDASDVRLLAPSANVTEHPATDDDEAHLIVAWPDVHMTIRFMPENQIAEHLDGFLGYVRTACTTDGSDVIARIEAVRQVLAVVVAPGFDEDDRCETVLRGVAELQGALLFRQHLVYDATGKRLAWPSTLDDGEGA